MLEERLRDAAAIKTRQHPPEDDHGPESTGHRDNISVRANADKAVNA